MTSRRTWRVRCGRLVRQSAKPMSPGADFTPLRLVNAPTRSDIANTLGEVAKLRRENDYLRAELAALVRDRVRKLRTKALCARAVCHLGVSLAFYTAMVVAVQAMSFQTESGYWKPPIFAVVLSVNAVVWALGRIEA